MRHFRKIFSINHLRTGFWAVMLLSHTPAAISAWKECWAGHFTVTQMGQWIPLALSMIFFALKVQGVHWLRFRADRRACLAFTLAIGLVHLDCIQPGLEQKIPIDCTAVLTTTVLAVFTLRVSRSLSDVLKHSHAHKTIRSLLPVSSNTVWYDVFHPHCWILISRNNVSRAPPA